jgi:hypothetical protein
MSPASEYLDSYLNGQDQLLLSLKQMLSLKFSSAGASVPYSETILDGEQRSLVPPRPHPKPTSSVSDFGGLEGSPLDGATAPSEVVQGLFGLILHPSAR